MVKSNRRRRQDRAKRQATAAGRQAAAVRRRLREEAVVEAERRIGLLRDPGTPVDTVAAVIQEGYAPGPVMPGLAALLAERRGSAGDVVKIAETLDAIEPGAPSLTKLTFGAHAAHLAGDHVRARRLMDQAMEQMPDPEQRLELVAHLRMLGRVADVLDLLAAHVADPAYGAVAAEVHAAVLQVAERRLGGDAPAGGCPCGGGTAWAECCQAREAAAVERFGDRSGLYALRTAVAEFLPGSRYDGPVAEHVAEWLDGVETDAWEPPDLEPLRRLAIEHAWIAAGADQNSDSDEDNVLTALAEDRATPPEIAAAARVWREHVRYGLWQVADPTPGPGLWCVELVTGHELYVAFAPEQVQHLPRWSVLLGALVPLDGAWRATGTLIRATPAEADALCETIRAATDMLISHLGGGRPSRNAMARARRPAPFGSAPPHNVHAYLTEPASAPAVVLLSRVAGSLLPRLVAELHAARAATPAPTNTDGDPLRMIKARVRVHDPDDLTAQLADDPDFEADPDDPARLSWYGQQIPAAQAAAMLAEVRAQLRAQGHHNADITDPDRPQRWVRGQLRLHGDQLTVEVNSQHRLDRLLELLDELGARPTVIDQTTVDPTQDLPWPAGHLPLGGGLAPPEDGWEGQWLDEPVPALRGRTPRQAASSDHWPLLEGLLRQLEYDADLLALDGQRGADTAWLRDQLDMPADKFT